MSDPISDFSIPPEALTGTRGEGEGPPGRPPRTWLFGSVLFLMVIVGAAATGAYLSITALLENQEEVRVAWTEVQRVHQQRVRTVEDLRMLLPGLGSGWDSLREWNAARGRADAAPGLADEVTAMPAADRALRRVVDDLRTRPGLPGGCEELLARLRDLQQRQQTARQAFNEHARRYRVLLERIPTRWAALFMGFDRVPMYEDAPSG